METPKQEQVKEQPSETAPSPLYLIEKVINIFGWVVKFVLVIVFVAIIFYGVLVVAVLIVTLFGSTQIPPEAAAPILEMINSTLDRLSPLMAEFWNLLKPVLQLVIIVVLLRWLFFSQQGPLAGQFRNIDIPSLVAILVISAIAVITLLGLNTPPVLTNIALIVVILVLVRGLLFSQEGRLPGQMRNLFADVPSAIAVLIIGTISLVTILGMDIPEALANIALVIVGFYFGQDRLRKRTAQDEANSEKPDARNATGQDKGDTTS